MERFDILDPVLEKRFVQGREKVHDKVIYDHVL